MDFQHGRRPQVTYSLPPEHCVGSSNLAVFFSDQSPIDGLSTVGQAPKIFSRVSRRGLPYVSVMFCSSFTLIAFMGVKSEPGKGTSLLVNPLHPLIPRVSVWLVPEYDSNRRPDVLVRHLSGALSSPLMQPG